MKQSNKTFYTATGAGLSIILTAAASKFETGRDFAAAGFQVICGLCLVGVGLWARDDDVSDYGTVAPKDLTLPPEAMPPQPPSPGAPTP